MSIMKTYENHLLWRYVKVITCYLIDPLNLLMKVGGCYAVYLLQWLYVCWLLMVLQDDRILFEGKSYGLWVLPDVTIRLQSKDTNTTTCSMNWTSLGWSTLDVETPTDTVSWLYSWRIQCIRIAFPFDHPDHTRVPMDGIDKQKRLFF